MAEQTPESKPEVVSQESPTPKFTEPSAVSSPSTVDIDALADKVAAKMMPSVEKLIQSQKDKRIAKMEKQMEAAGLSELEEMGVQIPEPVKTEMRLRRLEEAREPTPVQEPSKGKGGTSDSEQVSAVIKETGLDANTPEVIKLLGGEYRNLDHFRAEAFALRARQATKPAPDASAAPSLNAGTRASSSLSEAERETIGEEIVTLMRNPTGNAERIAKLQAQLKG